MTQVSIERVSKMRQYQRLNHFPSMLEICRKGPLSRHMARMAQRLPEEYNFYPHAYNLPDQLEDLLVQLRRNEAKVSKWRQSYGRLCFPVVGGPMCRHTTLLFEHSAKCAAESERRMSSRSGGIACCS